MLFDNSDERVLAAAELAWVRECLIARRALLHVMGPHANEDVQTIFRRKMADIETYGKTYWFTKSVLAPPLKVQRFAAHANLPVLIYSPADLNSESDPDDQIDEEVQEVSVDGRNGWMPIDVPGVTGWITPDHQGALVFDRLIRCSRLSEVVDIDSYCEWDTGAPVSHAKPKRNGRTLDYSSRAVVCAVRERPILAPRAHRTPRWLWAVATLATPYSVFVR